jgi:uncharacterized protein YjiS (DUF1127 family)
MLTFIGHFIHQLAVTGYAWQQRRRAYAELAGLDDRSLADIGITRSEIPFVLAQASYEPGFEAGQDRAASGNLQHAA